MAPATLDGWMAERTGLASPLTRAALEAWQLTQLRATVTHARAASPFYRSYPQWPDVNIRSLRDMARLPFTYPADLFRSNPPFLALSQGEIARVVTLATSGTSGLRKRLHFTAEDQEATTDFFHHGMGVFTRPGDRVAVAFPGDRPGSIGDGLATALRRLDATPLLMPQSADSADFVAMLRAEKPDIIAGPPVPLLAAARISASDGGAPVAIRAVLLSSDHVARSLSRAISKAWGAEVYEHWGMTETGYGGAVDCALHAGCHIRENELYVEIVDPETGEPLPHGAPGEVVITTLRRRGLPLLRYRTGDLARLIDVPCGCGSVLRRLSDFAGRIGAEAKLPGGGVLALQQLDEALFEIEAITDFAATIRTAHPMSLVLTIATPKHWRSPDVADSVKARLAPLPNIGPALADGTLRLSVDLASASTCQHDGKRRLHIRGAEPCAPCC